jgi:hypothetical protein
MRSVEKTEAEGDKKEKGEFYGAALRGKLMIFQRGMLSPNNVIHMKVARPTHSGPRSFLQEIHP